MISDDRALFSELLFAYKRLWWRHQEFKYLTDHPGADPEHVHEEFLDLADDLFQPLADALVEGLPLEDALRKLVRGIDHPQV